MVVLYSNLLSLNIEFLILDQLNNIIRNKNYIHYYIIIHDNIIVDKIIYLTDKLINNIIFSWIPGHCGITGNEREDVGTRYLPRKNQTIHINDISGIWTQIKIFKKLSTTNLKINGKINNKLNEIKRTTEKLNNLIYLKRRDEVVHLY